MSKIKIIYRKNLKMSAGKIASQAVHAAMYLRDQYSRELNVVVLPVSDNKFDMETASRDARDCYIQYDKGLTEVDPDTATAAAWIETQ